MVKTKYTMGKLISIAFDDSSVLTGVGCIGPVALTRRCIDRNPYLADRRIHWPDIETLRYQLLNLLERNSIPDLCLLLTKGADGSYDWKSFRSNRRTKIFSTKKPNFRLIERVVINIYLSHIAQLCCEAVAPDSILVLDPEVFIAHTQNRRRGAGQGGLATIINTAREVRLVPGNWQNRCAVLKWRASLAVWRKKRQDESLTAHSSVPPLSDDPPPAYGSLPPAYSATESKNTEGSLKYDS